MPFDDDGNPVNQPEFMLEPNASITGSEYFNTASEDKFERVSPMLCGKIFDDVTKKSISAISIVLEILFILMLNKGKYSFKKLIMINEVMKQILFLYTYQFTGAFKAGLGDFFATQEAGDFRNSFRFR